MTEGGATEAHRAAVAGALLCLVGTALTVVGYWAMSGTAMRAVEGVSLLTSSAALVVLRMQRVRRSAAASDAIFLLLLAPLVVVMWMIDAGRAVQDVRWVPYEGHKMAALVIAMIAPPHWWIGVTAILVVVGTAVVHHFVLPSAVRAHMVAGEPLGIVFFGAIALALLGIMQRSRALRVQLEQARSERLALARLARLAMSLRDLANTPLQTLELVRQALLTDGERLPVQVERMRHALDRLRRLNDILRPYQDAVAVDIKRPTAGER